MNGNKNEIPRILREPPANGTYTLTESQQKRKARGQSLWERDKQVKPYTVHKGKYV